MKRPSSLKAGDRIRIVAPARKISKEELEPALAQIRKWGFEPYFTEKLWAESHQFAGDDSTRITDFQEALDDPECRAILCARGGYGSVRLIDSLNFRAFQKSPKWLIGFSDITVFHSALHNLGWCTLHASMPINFAANTSQSLTTIYKALTGEDYQITAPHHRSNRTGLMQGEIVGGNLSMIYSLLGSPSSIDPKGKILFFEDLDEYLYHVDRMMWNLKRNAYFEAIEGILIGTLTDMNDNNIPFGESASEIVARHFSDYSFPVAFGIPAGHQSDNQCLIFGQQVRVSVDSSQTLIRFQNESQPKTGS